MTEDSQPFILTRGKERVVVKRSWITRWSFLSDLVDELHVTTAEWNYTPFSQLRLWARVNEGMDRSRAPAPLVALSSIWDTIDFMSPSDASYLQYVEIDSALPDGLRRGLYDELGSLIRRRGERPIYLQNDVSCGAALYYHFDLYHDPAYGVAVDSDRTLYLQQMPEEVQELVLSIPNGIITGIMHQTYLKSMADSSPLGEEEIPWYYVPWRDVALFYPHALGTYYRVHQDVRRSLSKSVDELEVEELRVRVLAHATDPYTLPFILSDVQPPDTPLDEHSSYVAVRSTGGSVVVDMPRFSEFWDGLMDYILRVPHRLSFDQNDEGGVPYSDAGGVGLGLYSILASPDPDDIAEETRYEQGADATYDFIDGFTTLWQALSEYNVFLFCGTRNRRQVETVEYPSLCRRIVTLVGKKTLKAYAHYFRSLLEDGRLASAPRLRMLEFVEVALKHSE